MRNIPTSLLKQHCYCPMLLMRTTKTAVCNAAHAGKCMESQSTQPPYSLFPTPYHPEALEGGPGIIMLILENVNVCIFFLFFFFIVFFSSYCVFRIAVLPHSPGVVYYLLLLRRETRIPGVAPFSFRIGIWDLLSA